MELATGTWEAAAAGGQARGGTAQDQVVWGGAFKAFLGPLLSRLAGWGQHERTRHGLSRDGRTDMRALTGPGRGPPVDLWVVSGTRGLAFLSDASVPSTNSNREVVGVQRAR